MSAMKFLSKDRVDELMITMILKYYANNENFINHLLTTYGTLKSVINYGLNKIN